MMADSFLYQPHVQGADGVLTPDLVIDNLAVAALPDPQQVRPLPVNLLTSATEIQQLGDTACGSAAMVVVAAGRGAIVTVGSDHWDPELGEVGVLAHQTCAKPIGREAIRLEDCGVNADIVLRTFHIRKGSQTLVGETPLDGLNSVSKLIAAWSSGSEPPPRSVIFISVGHRDAAAQQADGYRVELEHPRTGTRLECAYGVRRL